MPVYVPNKKKKESLTCTYIKSILGCYVRHHQVLLRSDPDRSPLHPAQESALQTTHFITQALCFPTRPLTKVVLSVVAMATSSRKYSVPALHLCVLSALLLCLLTADVTVALDHKEPSVVDSTEAFYLRGIPSVNLEGEESYESFQRRELAEYDDPSANCSTNCDVP